MQLVLLSGGSGTRLWPLSNVTRSKQFLPLLETEDGGMESMIQRVIRQVNESKLTDNITLATNSSQLDIIKNQLGVKHIIYVAPEYFENIYKMEGVDKSDLKARQAIIDREKKAFSDFLSGEKNANKAVLAMKERIPTATGTMESKWIEITTIDNKITGGEYIDDTESTANIICYAMGVHSSLIGATPGKSSSTLGGTQARELYMMKQACMKPIVDRVMRPLRFVKQFNKWDKDLYINIPEYIFTTLDQNKSGKQESTNTQA